MQVLLENFSWMLFNVILALIPIVFGWIMYKSHNLVIKIAAGFIWLFFLPNTIYLLTDIINFKQDATRLTGIYLAADLLLYILLMIIGVITFIMALDPFEKMLLRARSKRKLLEHKFIIYALNFLVGFGLVLGRVHRVNSWEVITDLGKVIYYSLKTLESSQLMLLVLAFAILTQAVYLFCRKVVVKSINLK